MTFSLTKPKVSVIIPIYGVEKEIERCSRSLFAQTLDDIEYLFIDDCSPDNSIDILRHVMEDYPERKSQVRIHRMEKNSGQAKVREWGMRNAKGQYIIHCDSDDWVELDMYRSLYYRAVKESADVVVCDYYESDGNKNIKKVKCCLSTDKHVFIDNVITQKTPWQLWNKLIRRECYIHDIVYPHSNMGEDMSLILQIMLNCQKIIYEPTALYHYYCNPKSITHEKDKSAVIKNYYHVKDNTDIVLDAFCRKNEYNNYADSLVSLKWMVRNYIWKYTADKEMYNLWRNTYPEIEKVILFNSKLPTKEKVRYVLTALKINCLKEK